MQHTERKPQGKMPRKRWTDAVAEEDPKTPGIDGWRLVMEATNLIEICKEKKMIDGNKFLDKIMIATRYRQTYE